jgi:putative two-component system response regulator
MPPDPAPGAPSTEKRPVILVADDSEDMRNLFQAMLKAKYELKFAETGTKALALADMEPIPDLVLLDVEMPETDGYDVLAKLKANPALAAIPVIFVSGRADPKDQARGLMGGAVDYIVKPISAPLTLLRVRAHLALQDQRRDLEEQVLRRTEELRETQLQLIRRLARAMEYREGGVTNRVLRVARYVELMGQAMGLKDKVCEVLALAAPLYDIGKMGVAEHILRKTDKLNEKEWEEIRRHPEIGAKIIGEHKEPLLEQARVMALTHHERWDGTGYPKGLKGDDIPLPGRIMAVADAFEAMTATQRHRSPLSPIEAAKKIAEQSGKQFDPQVVAAFQKVAMDIEAVRKEHRDELEGIHNLDFSVGAPAKPAAAAPAAAARPAAPPRPAPPKK